MPITALHRARLRRIGWVIGISGAIGGIFGFFAGLGSELQWRAVAAGCFSGAVASALVAGFELFVVPDERLRKARVAPLAMMALSALGYVVVWALVIQSGFVLVGIEPTGWGWTDGNFLFTVAAALIIGLGFSAWFSISRILGSGALFKFLTGRYLKPRAEERIFLMLDMVGSTRVAEAIGPLQFHKLLNDVFCDITEPILANRGGIYNYVGDQVIVSWRPDDGLRDALCLRCYFDIVDELVRRADGYDAHYRVRPSFRGALHIGTVVVGEMGSDKQAIVYLGDTLNTVARIEETCRKSERPALVSQALVERLPETAKATFAFEALGPVALRGKTEPLSLLVPTRRTAAR